MGLELDFIDNEDKSWVFPSLESLHGLYENIINRNNLYDLVIYYWEAKGTIFPIEFTNWNTSKALVR